jgi:hypothetical protein
MKKSHRDDESVDLLASDSGSETVDADAGMARAVTAPAVASVIPDAIFIPALKTELSVGTTNKKQRIYKNTSYENRRTDTGDGGWVAARTSMDKREVAPERPIRQSKAIDSDDDFMFDKPIKSISSRSDNYYDQMPKRIKAMTDARKTVAHPAPVTGGGRVTGVKTIQRPVDTPYGAGKILKNKDYQSIESGTESDTESDNDDKTQSRNTVIASNLNAIDPYAVLEGLGFSQDGQYNQLDVLSDVIDSDKNKSLDDRIHERTSGRGG